MSRRIRLSKAFDTAVGQWEIDPLDRFRVRLMVAARPKIRHAVLEFVREKAAADDAFEIAEDHWIDLERLAELLALIVKYLPLILEIILPLFTSDAKEDGG